MNYGIRWDYFGVPSEKNNLFYQLTSGQRRHAVPSGRFGGPVEPLQQGLQQLRSAFRLAYDLRGNGTRLSAPAMAFSTMPSRRTSFWATFPITASSVPARLCRRRHGADRFASANSGPITPICRCTERPRHWAISLAWTPNYRDSLRAELEPEHRAADNQQDHAASRYVGSKGTKLFRFRDINQPNQGAITPHTTSRSAAPRTCLSQLPGFYDYGVPRTAFPNFFYVNQEESTANPLQSLQTSLKLIAGTDFRPRRTTCGRIPSTTPATSRISSRTLRSRIIAWRPQPERGNSNFDIRHRFSLNFAYQFPKSRANTRN